MTLPKSGLQFHICQNCGRKFTCSEHCSSLWKSVNCLCHRCDGLNYPPEKRKRYRRGKWYKACASKEYDWIKEWIKKVVK